MDAWRAPGLGGTMSAWPARAALNSPGLPGGPPEVPAVAPVG